MSFGTSIASHFGKAPAVGTPASITAAYVNTLANATLSATGTVVSSDPVATMITALLAATSWHGLYVAGTDLATSKQDKSGNGLNLTSSGGDPTYNATSVASRPGLAFPGDRMLVNSSGPDLNGGRIGMVLVGIANTNASIQASLGGAFSANTNFDAANKMNASSRFATVDSQIAIATNNSDSSVHCWAIWMRAASNDAEVDGAAFATDFSGNAVLDTVDTTQIRWGGGPFFQGTGTHAVFGFMPDPDNTKIAAIESAINACYGITFT